MRATGEKLTVRDFMARPEEHGVQLIDGALVMEPPPSLYHQDIVRNLVVLLNSHVTKRRLGKIYCAPVGVFLSEHDVFEPDVLFVSAESHAVLRPDGVHGGPDLVVEVLSPSTARIDAGRKRELYFRHGVKEMWLVDPKRRQIQRFEFARDAALPVETIEETETFSSSLFPGLVISAEEIFRS